VRRRIARKLGRLAGHVDTVVHEVLRRGAFIEGYRETFRPPPWMVETPAQWLGRTEDG